MSVPRPYERGLAARALDVFALEALASRIVRVPAHSSRTAHPHRPWLLTTPEERPARHDYETGIDTPLLTRSDPYNHTWGWAGDNVVVSLQSDNNWVPPSATHEAALVDGDGAGFLTIVSPLAETPPRFNLVPQRTYDRRPVPRFEATHAGPQWTYRAATALPDSIDTWNTLVVRGDQLTLRAARTPHMPAWHPDGHCYAFPHRRDAEVTSPWSLMRVEGATLHEMPLLGLQPTLTTARAYAWIGPRTLLLVMHQQREAMAWETLVLALDPWAGTQQVLSESLGPHRMCLAYQCSPNHTRLALLLQHELYTPPELAVIDLATGETRFAETRFPHFYEGSHLCWIDDDTLAWVSNVKSPMTMVAACLLVWSLRTQHEQRFAVKKQRSYSNVRSVNASAGRLRLGVETTEGWYLLITDPLVSA